MTKEEMLAIVKNAQSEKRALTDEEKSLLDAELETRQEEMAAEEPGQEPEKEAEPEEDNPSGDEPVKEEDTPKEDEPKEETRNNNNKVTNNKKMEKRFSLVRSIRAISNNQPLDAVDQAVIDAGRAENRSYDAQGQIQLPTNIEERGVVSVAAEGEDIVATDLLSIWGPLRAKNVLINAGAKVYDNLVGDVQIPLMGKSSVTWEGETSDASDGAPTFSHVSLSPKRLTAYVAISKKLIAQDSIGVENAVRQELINAINAKLEETLLGTVAGDTTKPAGIFAELSATTATSANTVTDFGDVCEVEASIEDENVMGECTYVMSNKAKAAFRGMIKGTNATGMVYENGEMDGTKAFNTSNIANKGFLYGDFGNLVIGNWSGVDITVDPYTLAGAGQVKLVVNMFVDAKLVRKNAIKAGYVA